MKLSLMNMIGYLLAISRIAMLRLKKLIIYIPGWKSKNVFIAVPKKKPHAIESGEEILDAEVQESLRALGYVR